jgi:hypothetical protein
MIRLFRRAPATRAGRPHTVFLRLEGLEGRATPSGDALSETSRAAVYNFSPVNQAPQIVDFAAQELGSGLFVFTGRVVGENPGGLTVTFGGSVATMNGRTCTTDANGNFSVVVQLKTDGTDVGWVLATTRDAHGVTSDEAAVFVHPTPS